VLSIVHQDPWLVAVYKPAGWLVHRSRLDAGERHCVLQTLRDQIGRRVYPVHRLDRPTSGLLLFALEPHVARLLGEAFTERRVEKTYLGVARGYVDESGTVDHPLDSPEEGLGPRAACTEYQCLARAELPVPSARHPTSRYSLLRLRPHTGRRHQLRRHMKHIAHPLVGDTTHGDGWHNRVFREHFSSHRLLLCAVALAFEHPTLGQRLRLEVAPDADFLRVLEAVNGDWPSAALPQSRRSTAPAA
jgi:tRNA pseudouridine65 synthase